MDFHRSTSSWKLHVSFLVLSLVPVVGCGAAPDFSAEDDSSAVSDPLSNGDMVQITSQLSGKCLGLLSGQTAAGSLPLVSTCSGADNQAWKFVANTDGSYAIVGKQSGRCLDIPNGSATDGVKPQIWDCWSGDMQRWYVDQSSGFVQIRNKASNKCLDMWSTSDQAPIQQYTCHTTGNNQRWTLVGATSPGVVINPSQVYQRISGFGASTAWASSMSDADADQIFSPTIGAGLSLHRIRIAPDGTTSETSIAKKSQARGATVWATPWSPAAAYKTNNNVVGGKLANGKAWASSLAKFVQNMKASGVNVSAVSAENEPDANVSYESCSYTPTELASFMGTYLGPALAGTGAKLMGPESQNWC